MDYSRLGLFSKRRKTMIILFGLLLWCSASATTLGDGEISGKNQSESDTPKAEVTKREEPEAQRRDHSFNQDGSVNYHGSGSGHDSGDLVPPPGGGIFNSPSLDISSSGPTGLSNSYGAPIPSDSYGPPKNIFHVKPPSASYGPPSQQYGPPNNKYLPPKPVYGPPKPPHRPSPPKPVYGPPVSFNPPKSTYGPPKGGRPKPNFSSRPKPVYGPPKQSFGGGFSHATLLSPVGNIKTQYGPPKISATYGTPLQPSTSYGSPKHPKGGHISAPPTPPIVKYDGWKPIPGLVSNPPSGSYGPPEASGHGFDFGGAGQISGGGFDGLAPPASTSFSISGPSSAYGAPSFGGSSLGGSSFGGSSFGGSSHGGSSHGGSSFGGSSFGGSSFGFSGFGIELQPSTSYGPPPKPSPSYGTPLHPSTSYGPPGKGPSKGNFLSSIKGLSISHGPPEPSLSPSPPKPSYGPPKPSYGPPKISNSYGPPKAPSISYGPPSGSFRPPKLPSVSYGPPKLPSSSYGPPKPPSTNYGPPKFPSSSYGPPKPPSSSYGPPSVPISSYGPPTSISSSFIPPKPPGGFIPPKAPNSAYGPPSAPSNSYGLPKPPSTSYGPPQVFTTYTIPKPSISVGATPNTAYRGPSVPHPLQPPSTAYGVPSFSSGLYKTPLPPNALYGVPTAPAPPIFDAGFQAPSSTYGAPLTNLHAPLAPIPSIDISSQFGSSGSGSLFPSTSYGTPVVGSTQSTYHPPASTYGVPTALPLRQPKNPVKFRPPVPPGLISSIGAKWGDSAAWGANAQTNKFQGNTYIPPAVPDPDPGIQANKGNALVIPPPSAPPINYGPPAPTAGHEEHHHVSNTFPTATSHSTVDLNPPPAPQGHSGFDIQQSASVELPSNNNLEQHVSSNSNYFPPGGHQSAGISAGQDFSSGVHVRGNHGSYTLQIQAAGGNSGEHIPHNEVLSNGLLQDILTAIENPSASGKLEQYTGPQNSDPVGSEIGLNILKQLGGADAQHSNSIQLPSQYGSDLSLASSNNIPLVNKNSEISLSQNVTDQALGTYLNQQDVAFYYKNEESVREKKENNEKDLFLVQMLLPNNTTNTNSQSSDIGALVSIKLQNAQIEPRNSTAGPVRTSRLDSSTVRVTPYPQPTVYSQPQVAIPDSTVQEDVGIAAEFSSSKQATEQATSGVPTETFAQGKTNVGQSCVQNSATGPYGTTATIPVIQPSCVLPVEQLIGNGVLTNFSNGNCVPGNPCFTTVLPANVLGVNSNACVPVTPRFQTSVVDSSVAITDCRCQAEGSGCCHSTIASYPSAQGPTSMIFVPYSLPNFPPQQRGNPAPKTSPCGGTTPVKEAKGSRATSPRSHPKPDTSQHYHIFVGDLSPEIDTQTLRDAFAPFGEISDSRVVRDAQTLKSKGYGFVSFIKKSEAKSAIAAMNGRWLGSRSIRTNWATRKPPLIKADGNPLPLSFDEVYKQSSASNCTVYCGGIINGLTEELVQKIFSPFGNIQEIKVFKDKGYAFVRFSTKESAAHAIVAVHNTEVNGQMVKCSWGKESSELGNIQTGAQFDQPVANANFPYAYSQQMGYWYPQSFPAATTQIPGQYLQSGFSLGQFGYHQDFIGRLSMSSIWNGMPGQTQLPTAMQTIGQGTAIQQPNSVVAAYPVQRFQLSEDEWTTPSLLV